MLVCIGFALLGFVAKPAVWFHNCILNNLSSLTPMELLTKTKVNHCDLLFTHVWGCPVNFVEPKLQDGQKIPKWKSQSRFSLFLQLSNVQSSLVANVYHNPTGYVSPHYHWVFDGLIETVFSTGNDVLLDDICNYLF